MVKDVERITLVAVILAIFFGVVQSVPAGTKFSLASLELPLFVIAKSGFGLVLLVFLVYCISVGTSWHYRKPAKNDGVRAFFYDLGIALTGIIIIATLFLHIGMILDSLFKTQFLGGLMLIIALVVTILILCKLGIAYKLIKGDFMSGFFKKIRKWFMDKFTLRRIFTSVKFSAIVGVTYWATTVYETAFQSGKWQMALLAFVLVSVVLLIFGSGLLDAMKKD